MKVSIHELKRLNSMGVLNSAVIGSDGKLRVTDGGIGSAVGFNASLPGGVLTEIAPKEIDVLLSEMTSEKIAPMFKALSFEQTDMQFSQIEKVGETSDYSDFGNPAVSSVNPSFIQRGHYVFSSSTHIGRRKAMQLQRARINLSDKSRASAFESLKRTQNRTAYFGYGQGLTPPVDSLYPVYGVLNDPSLLAYEESTETVATMTFKGLYNDIVAAIGRILEQTQGVVKADDKITVYIANSIYIKLALLSDYDHTAIEVMKKAFPTLEFVPVPEFDKAYNGTNDVIYVVAENNAGGVPETIEQGFSEIALASAVVVEANAEYQEFHSGSCGALPYKPTFISRMYIKSA